MNIAQASTELCTSKYVFIGKVKRKRKNVVQLQLDLDQHSQKTQEIELNTRREKQRNVLPF